MKISLNKVLIASFRISGAALAKKFANDNPSVEIHLLGTRIQGDLPANLIQLDEATSFIAVVNKIKSIHANYDFIIANDLTFQTNLKFQTWISTVSVPVFCPDSRSSMLEFSKLTTKEMLADLKIPNAEYEEITVNKWGEVQDLKNIKFHSDKFVLKLIYGGKLKGDQPKAVSYSNFKDIIKMHRFSGIGYYAEEYISGRELSAHFLCNGTSWVYLGSARDYKKLYDGDQGENCASAGCYSPVDYVTADVENQMFEYMNKILNYLNSHGIYYKGMMYLGLILDQHNIANFLEINTRPGNPEFNTIVNCIHSTNLLENFYNAATGKDLLAVEFNDQVSVSISVINKDYGLPAFANSDRPKLEFDKNVTVCYFDPFSINTIYANVSSTGTNLEQVASSLTSLISTHDLKDFRIRLDIGKLK